MESTVVFGGLLSIVGLYALLTRQQTTADNAVADSKSLLDQVTSRAGTGYALTLTGLLILISVASRPAAWWGESLLDGPLPTGVFWFGTLSALTGAITVAFAASDRTAFAGVALAGTGGALLFGLAGNLVAGLALISAAAAGGWATRFLPSTQDATSPSFPEPLLLTVSIVALFVLTASTLHRSATSESPLAETYETGSRSLPRPSVARRQATSAATSGTLTNHEPIQHHESPWHSVSTYGLLILVVAIGIWQQLSQRNSHTDSAISSPLTDAVPSFNDENTKRQTELKPPATGD